MDERYERLLRNLVRLRNRPIFFVGLSLLVLFLGIVGISIIKQRAQADVTWGGSSLCVSERDYFMAQMKRLMESWNPIRHARRLWEVSAKNKRLLAIDLRQGIVWLEPGDRSWESESVSLPRALSWTLYLCTKKKPIPLPSYVCLKPPSTSSHATVALVGQGSDNTYLICSPLGSLRNNIVWREGAFDPNTLKASGSGEPLSSLVITDSQQLQEMARYRPTASMNSAGRPHAQDISNPGIQHRLTWQGLQRPLFEALEEQVRAYGYTPARISVAPGPDYSAGLAGVSVQTDKPRSSWRFHRFWRWLGFKPPLDPITLLTIEPIDDGRWHCRTVDRSLSNSIKQPLPLDFFVHSSISVPPARDRQPELKVHESKWSVALDKGKEVKVIGVCRHRGGKWWQPDGSILENWPGFLGRESGPKQIRSELTASVSKNPKIVTRWNRGPRDLAVPDEGHCAVVLYVPSSVGFKNNFGFKSKNLASVYYGKAPLLNRFGQAPLSGQYIVLTFEMHKHKTVNHGLGIHVCQDRQAKPRVLQPTNRKRDYSKAGTDNRIRTVPVSTSRNFAQGQTLVRAPVDNHDISIQWIRLENISLHPGQPTDFKITRSPSAAELPSTTLVQVRP